MNRSPHFNLDAERAVLGSLLLDPEALARIIAFLKKDDFFRETHQWIYEALIGLHARNEPTDYLMLADELERMGKLSEVGGVAALSELSLAVPTAIHIEHYAHIVERNALLRRLVAAAERIAKLAYEESDKEVSEIIERAERELFAVSQHRLGGAMLSLKEILGDFYDQVEELYMDRTAVGLQTGFTDLDRLLGGLQAGDLLILAARPSVGKSSLALSILESSAVKYGARVALFSLEMGVEQIAQRLVSSQTGVDAQRLRVGPIYEEDLERINFAVEVLGKTTVFVDETPAISPVEMRTKLRRVASEYGLDLVIVDYLQLMSSGRGSENRVQEISAISRMLKETAREMKVPVLALSQLSRGVESRQDKRPMLSDLRESGCLAGETLIPIADTGESVALRDLVGQSGVVVWALDEATKRLERAPISNAFSTGVKPIFRLTTHLGRTIRATANHQFLTWDGWLRLDALSVGRTIAIPTAHLADDTPVSAPVAAFEGWVEALPETVPMAADDARGMDWDEIVSIEAAGEEEVFDLTVPGRHNFIANDIIVHNSIEQDADVVMFIYRDDVYNKNSERPNLAEIIVAKHRNGPTGMVELRFTRENTRFSNLETYTFGDSEDYGPPPAPVDMGLDDVVF